MARLGCRIHNSRAANDHVFMTALHVLQSDTFRLRVVFHDERFRILSWRLLAEGGGRSEGTPASVLLHDFVASFGDYNHQFIIESLHAHTSQERLQKIGTDSAAMNVS